MEKESLYYLVKDAAATYAERPAFWVKPDNRNFKAISYFNWRLDMKRFQAFLLESLHLKSGDRVGLLCDNRYEWSLISLGIVTIGGVDVPRGCDATYDEIVYILSHTECNIVVVEHEKMLRTLIGALKELSQVKHIISIDPPEKYKNLTELTRSMRRVKLHFLLDAFGIGEEVLEQKGETFLIEKGEAIRPNDLATIIYTSGTTGKPRGVMLEHRNFCWEVSQIQMVLPISEQDRTVIFLPPWHIAERVLELTMIACGASMACSSILALAVDLKLAKPSILLSVPRVWEQLYKKIFDNVRKQPALKQTLFNYACNTAAIYTDIKDTLLERFADAKEDSVVSKYVRKVIALLLLPLFGPLVLPARIILRKVKDILGGRVRFAVSGAGALPDNVALFFRGVGVPVIDAYGMTETTAVSVIGALPWPRRGAIGNPLPGVQIQLRDATDKIITQAGVKGVLWHKGPHVMRGYYKDPEKTAAVLREGWLNSGDIFQWTLSGEAAFAGREKDTIVLAGGENIEPGPIELKLLGNEFINQIVVVGQDRKSLGLLLVPEWERCCEYFLANESALPEDHTLWNKDEKIRTFFKNIIKREISTANGFKSLEKPTRLYIVPTDFRKGKEMTATMKIKRNVVFEIFKNEIDEMFR